MDLFKYDLSSQNLVSADVQTLFSALCGEASGLYSKRTNLKDRETLEMLAHICLFLDIYGNSHYATKVKRLQEIVINLNNNLCNCKEISASDLKDLEKFVKQHV